MRPSGSIDVRRRRGYCYDGIETLLIDPRPTLGQPDGWGWDWERWRRPAR